jgi:hypothetical protein
MHSTSGIVEVLQAQNGAANNGPDLLLPNSATAQGRQHIGHGAALAILHDDPHLIATKEAIKEGHDKGSPAIGEDLNFVHNLIGLFL